MALFGAPIALEDHAVRACLAALEIQQDADRLARPYTVEKASGTRCGWDSTPGTWWQARSSAAQRVTPRSERRWAGAAHGVGCPARWRDGIGVHGPARRGRGHPRAAPDGRDQGRGVAGTRTTPAGHGRAALANGTDGVEAHRANHRDGCGRRTARSCFRRKWMRHRRRRSRRNRQESHSP
jgi:hypothetical protein